MPTDDTIYLTRFNSKQVLAIGLNTIDPSGNIHYQNGVALTGTLTDREENVILVLNFQHVPNTDGNYEADIGPTFGPDPGIYWLTITGEYLGDSINLKRTVCILDRTS